MKAESLKNPNQISTAPSKAPGERWWRRFVAEKVWTNGPALLAASSLFWSGNFVVARAIQGAITPVELSFWRWLGALVLLSGFAGKHFRQDLGTLRSHWVQVLALAALGIAGMNTLFYRGLQSTTALNGLLLQSAAPLFVLSCGLALYGERPSSRQLVAILVSMLGVASIAAHGEVAMVWRGLGLHVGDLFILSGTLCYAGYTTILRRRPAVHATSLLTASVAAGVLLLLPFVILQHFTFGLAKPSWDLLAAVAYLAVLPSVLAFLCLNRGVELLGADRAGQYVHLMPLFGSVLAIMFLGERLHTFHAAGAVLIAAGLIMARGPEQNRFRLAWCRFWFCVERAEQRRMLRHADVQMLRDLGPGRVSHEREKPFWHD
jgi:drug/metabolite transporter (DMT)-like permease